MLPTHVGRRPAEPPSPEGFKLNRLASRPILRWIFLSLICGGFIWVFGPFLFEFTRQPSTHVVVIGEDKVELASQIPTLTSSSPPPSPVVLPSVWPARANKVRDAFVHAYSGYQKHALGYDELLPIKGDAVNK